MGFLPKPALQHYGGCKQKVNYRSWTAQAAESACALAATLAVAADLRKMLLATDWGKRAVAVLK